MDPILWMMLCSTVEAAASVVMGLGLFVLAVVEVKREISGKRKRTRRVKGSGGPGTW